jgi:hypothetical protein
MLAVAVMAMIPHALGRRPGGPLAILAGYLLVHLTQHVLTPHFHFGEETHQHEMVGPLGRDHRAARPAAARLLRRRRDRQRLRRRRLARAARLLGDPAAQGARGGDRRLDHARQREQPPRGRWPGCCCSGLATVVGVLLTGYVGRCSATGWRSARGHALRRGLEPGPRGPAGAEDAVHGVRVPGRGVVPRRLARPAGRPLLSAGCTADRRHPPALPERPAPGPAPGRAAGPTRRRAGRPPARRAPARGADAAALAGRGGRAAGTAGRGGDPAPAARRRRHLPSLILHGPPGSGKTTLARLLADLVDARFVPSARSARGCRGCARS